MRVRAILNPRAGVAAQRALGAVEEGRPFWPDLDVKITGKAGDARDFARQAADDGYPLVLALGGDGTANEIASGVLGSETAFGLVPVGSGNGLARTLGIPLEPRRAVAALGTASLREMDVGYVNDRLFLNVAGAGFDAAVGAAFHARGKAGGRRGVFTYLRLGVANLSYQAETWSLEAGSESYRGRALVLAFMNGRQYGGGAVMAPRAKLDDGLLDIVVVEDAPRLEVLLNAPRLWTGGIERYKRVRSMRAARASLTGSGSLEHHRDGEPEEGASRLEIRVEPRALKILVPKAVSEDAAGPFSV
jgi:YegS/Rv2252/BmrU family lipid kinase